MSIRLLHTLTEELEEDSWFDGLERSLGYTDKLNKNSEYWGVREIDGIVYTACYLTTYYHPQDRRYYWKANNDK